MEQSKYIPVALLSLAFAILAAPALAFPQGAPASGGGFGFGWVILLLVIGMAVAVVWFTVSQRRGAKHSP